LNDLSPADHAIHSVIMNHHKTRQSLGWFYI
jgi:hypothetical protein